MKILSISSLLPIPGVIKINDFLLHTYMNYKNLYKKDTIVILKPVAYKIKILKIIRKTTLYYKLTRSFTGSVEGFKVVLLPYISTWRLRNLHALITASVYYFNSRKLKTLLSSDNFTLFHAQYIFPDGLLAYMLNRRYGIPYVITPHNERFYFEHFLSKKIALKILRKSRMVLSLNYTNYLYFKSLNIQNLYLSPHGFSKEFLRDQKKADTRQTSIFTVAALIKLKNIDKVLHAISKLVPQNNIYYTIIGSGPEKENLQQLADQLQIKQHVRFIDYVPHDSIADEMYKHDIFIMPSYFETFGRVYFEAMAMGIPVICAKNSGIYGIFRDGEEGLSVNHNDVDDIKNALGHLIRNPEERLRIGKNGKKLVENYTWENIAISLHEKYIKVAETN